MAASKCCMALDSSPLRFCQKILYESKIQCTMIRDFYAKSDSQIVKYQQLIPDSFYSPSVDHYRDIWTTPAKKELQIKKGP